MRRNTESRKADEKSSLADNSNLKKKSRAAEAEPLFCVDNFFLEPIALQGGSRLLSQCYSIPHSFLCNVLNSRNPGTMIMLIPCSNEAEEGQVSPIGSGGSTFRSLSTLHAMRASRMEKASTILRWRSDVWARREGGERVLR